MCRCEQGSKVGRENKGKEGNKKGEEGSKKGEEGNKKREEERKKIEKEMDNTKKERKKKIRMQFVKYKERKGAVGTVQGT